MVISAGRFTDPGGVDDSDPVDDVGEVSELIAIETSRHVSGPSLEVAVMGLGSIASEPPDDDREVTVLSSKVPSRRTDDCVGDKLVVEQDWCGGVSGGGVRSLSESDGAILLR